MKFKTAKVVLALAAAAAAAFALTACGSSGTISSLTDSDSTASIAEGAAVDTNSVISGSASQAESVATSVPEILPQTVVATEVDAVPDSAIGTAEGTGAGAVVSLTGDDDVVAPVESEALEPVETAAAPAQTGEAPLITEDDEPTPAPEEESFEPAGEGNTGYVTGDEVNVREEPDASDDDNVMFTLLEGDEVRILGEEDGWYKIEVDGKTGWIRSSYIE